MRRLGLSGSQPAAGLYFSVDAQWLHVPAADPVRAAGSDPVAPVCARPVRRNFMRGPLSQTFLGGARASALPPGFGPARRPEGRRQAGRPAPQGGQALLEFALLYGAVLLPLTFMVIFVAEMLWIWHSVADFTRDEARYAA